MKFKKLVGIVSLSMTSQFFATSSLASSSFEGEVNLSEVEEAISEAMTRFNIPGLAVGIVHNDKVVLAKGYGVRHLDTNQAVNKQTLFGIASNSKAFTAAALAMLVDEGKLTWDDKVTTHIPEFQLKDRYATQEMTIRDLLSHRSGLGKGAGDLMIWPNTDKEVSELLAGLKHLPIDSSFRSKYSYNNLMFVVAGEVVSRVSGMSWQAFVEQKMFKPLGMNLSKGAYSRIPSANSNWATGHIPEPNGSKLTPFFIDYLEDFRGAGAIASNVDEMTAWLRTQLAGGVMPSGERLFSEQQQQQMWHPHITSLPSKQAKALYQQQFKGYGLGWSITDYYGQKRLGHGGGILGMVSQVAMLPEQKLGVVVLSNQQKYPALTAIINEVFEDVLGLPDKDWVEDTADSYFAKQNERYKKAGVKAVALKQASLPLNHYDVKLESPWYGEVAVELVGKELLIDFTHTKMLKGKLLHHSGHTFVVKWDEALLEADAYITFNVDKSQKVTAAQMEFVNPEISDFSFDFHNLGLKRKD